MSDIFPATTSGSSPSQSKGLFHKSKPENAVTAVVLGAAILAGIWFFAQLKTLVLDAMGTVVGLIGLTWALAGLMVTIMFFYWLFTSEVPRTFLWNIYKNLVRNSYKMLVAHDPVGITKNFIEKLQKQFERAEFFRTKVNAELVGMQKDLKDNERQAQGALEQAKYAKEHGNDRQAALLSTKAQTLKQSNDTMLPRYNQLQQVVTFLQRMADAASFELENTQTMVGIKQKEYERMQSSGRALNAFQAIFGAESEDKKLFDMAMSEMEDTINFRTAEMDRLMNTYETVLSSNEANKGVLLEHGMELLDRFQSGENVSLDLNAAFEKARVESQSSLAPNYSTRTPVNLSTPDRTSINPNKWS